MLNEVDSYRRSLVLPYGTAIVRHAEAQLERRKRFFGLQTPGADMQGTDMHQTLFAAYDKLFAPAADIAT